VLGRDQHLFCHLDMSWLSLCLGLQLEKSTRSSQNASIHTTSALGPHGQPGSSLATASVPGGDIVKRSMELWLLILATRKAPLRTALLEFMDSDWHLRSTDMNGGRSMVLPKGPLRSVCFGSWRAKEESGSKQWAQAEQERGTGLRDSCVPSLWRDHSSLQRVGREVEGWRVTDSQTRTGPEGGEGVG